jgi:hypothetical protein
MLQDDQLGVIDIKCSSVETVMIAPLYYRHVFAIKYRAQMFAST